MRGGKNFILSDMIAIDPWTPKSTGSLKFWSTIINVNEYTGQETTIEPHYRFQQTYF